MRHLLALMLLSHASAADLTATAYPSIQAALDANPNRMIFVPAGDHSITEKIRIRGERSGLFGPGRIIQRSADQPIIEIESADGAEIRDLTLTRPEGKMDTDSEGILAIKCRDLVIENVRVIDNRTRTGAIALRESHNCRISRCLVRNYMRVTIDDRTKSEGYGYAFNCTDGTGISVSYCTGTSIEGNRISEANLVPTPEIKAKRKLGDFTKKNARKGSIVNQLTWDANYVDNWRQGADLIITGNQFVKNCLWAIGLMPGAASNAENFDGGSIISNNIISDFGHGDAHWIWGDERSPFKFDTGQQPDDPPLTDVVVQGNIVHSIGKPRYKYAVIIGGGPNAPRGMHFSNNLLHPGTQGLSNTELPP